MIEIGVKLIILMTLIIILIMAIIKLKAYLSQLICIDRLKLSSRWSAMKKISRMIINILDRMVGNLN